MHLIIEALLAWWGLILLCIMLRAGGGWLIPLGAIGAFIWLRS